MSLSPSSTPLASRLRVGKTGAAGRKLAESTSVDKALSQDLFDVFMGRLLRSETNPFHEGAMISKQ